MKSVLINLFGIGSQLQEKKMLKFVALFALVFATAQAGKWDSFATFEDALAFEESNYDFDLFERVCFLISFQDS